MGVATAIGNTSYSIGGALGGAYELSGGDFIFSCTFLVSDLADCDYWTDDDAENSSRHHLHSSKVKCACQE